MKNRKDRNEVNEPLPAYESKRITFFNSHEDAEQQRRIEMAALTHAQLMHNLEQMRKLFMKQHLLPDGNWRPLTRIITIVKVMH